MRIATIDNRLCIVENEKYFDVARASDNRFGPDAQAVYDRWDEFTGWFESDFRSANSDPVSGRVGSPVPRPSQAFGVGLNYADHAAEADLTVPDTPLIFPKYSSCITGPDEPLLLDNETVDWEAELVVVIAREARNVSVADAWDHIAGLTVGQDISDRGLQWADPTAPEHGLAKSKPGYGIIGPVLVTPGEFADKSDLSITCHLNGEQMQASRTSRLIFDIPTLISYLSGILTVHPGDVVFTGTPSGIGMTRTPPRYLADGDTLRTEIEGIGILTTHAHANPPGDRADSRSTTEHAR